MRWDPTASRSEGSRPGGRRWSLLGPSAPPRSATNKRRGGLARRIESSLGAGPFWNVTRGQDMRQVHDCASATWLTPLLPHTHTQAKRLPHQGSVALFLWRGLADCFTGAAPWSFSVAAALLPSPLHQSEPGAPGGRVIR